MDSLCQYFLSIFNFLYVYMFYKNQIKWLSTDAGFFTPAAVGFLMILLDIGANLRIIFPIAPQFGERQMILLSRRNRINTTVLHRRMPRNPDLIAICFPIPRPLEFRWLVFRNSIFVRTGIPSQPARDIRRRKPRNLHRIARRITAVLLDKIQPIPIGRTIFCGGILPSGVHRFIRCFLLSDFRIKQECLRFQNAV